MIKKEIRKTLALLPALILLALGIACYIVTDMGSDPYTSFQIGIASLTGLSVGSINMITNIVIVFLFVFIDRSYVNIGSFIFAFGLGPLIDIFSKILFLIVPANTGFIFNVSMLILGTGLISLSIALYIPIKMGYTALDMVALKISEKLNTTYGNGLYIFYALLMAGALFMRVPVGLGTIINIIFVGKTVDIILPRITNFVTKMAGI